MGDEFDQRPTRRPADEADLAAVFRRWREGDAPAGDILMRAVHDELTEIATALIRREYRPVTLTASDLVSEAVIRLFEASSLDINDRTHLLALSARIMRRVLIDAARRRQADKRAAPLVTLTLSREPGPVDFDLIALDAALYRLQAIDPAIAEIVELRYFGGLTVEDVAVATGLSETKVKRMWRTARAWLREAIAGERKS